jgi:hypothetical protein
MNVTDHRLLSAVCRIKVSWISLTLRPSLSAAESAGRQAGQAKYEIASLGNR